MPPSAGTRVGCSGISLARPLAGSGLLLIALLLPVARHRCGARLMAWRYYHARSSLDLPTCSRRQFHAGKPKFQGTLLLPLRACFGLPVGVAPTPSETLPGTLLSELRQKWGYTALVMRSTIWSMVTESLFIALMMSTRARTLSCSCMYHL